MSERDNAELARAVIAAWNARDPRRYLALLSEDCIVESCHETPAQGHAAARASMQRYLTDWPDLWFEIRTVAATEHTALVSWRALTAMTETMGAAAPTPAPMAVHGCTVLGLEGGRVVRLWHYWDTDLFRRERPGTTTVPILDCME